jgi:hypothetical protein
MIKTPAPFSAIITGFGILGFSLLYYLTGIFPSRTGWFPRWTAVTAAENPEGFYFALVVSVTVGVGCLVWGLLRLR